MGKRGPKPSGKFAKKGATLGARITVDTRERLEAAAKTSGLSLSEEVENRLAESLRPETAEDHLLWLVRLCIERTEAFTGQSWLANPYTFDLMLAAVVEFISRFRPEGPALMPETMQPIFRGVGPLPEPMKQWLQQLRAKMEGHPPEAFAYMVTGGIVIALEAEGRGQHSRNQVEQAKFKRAAEHLKGLLTNPILEHAKREESK